MYKDTMTTSCFLRTRPLRLRASLVALLTWASVHACFLSACAEKKRNANSDIQKNQSSLMDQMDKIAAQEEAKRAEAKKTAEQDATASKPADADPTQPGTKTPPTTDTPTTPPPAEKPA